MSEKKAIVISIITAIVTMAITLVPVLIVKAYFSDLTQIDMFYGTMWGMESGLRELICFLSPVICVLVGTLAGWIAYKRKQDSNGQVGYKDIIPVSFIMVVIVNLSPCGCFYYGAGV